MKTLSISFCLITTMVSISGSAHAEDANFSYYQASAHTIAANLEARAANLSNAELIALRLLNEKSDSSPISVEHQTAEATLADAFRSAFAQADAIDFPGFKTETPFDAPRDVYTFCPSGSQVTRPISITSSPIDGTEEYDWGWSRCASAVDAHFVSNAIRIQDMWVSDVGHPLLTLLIVEDATKTNLNLDINALVAGASISKDVVAKILAR